MLFDASRNVTKEDILSYGIVDAFARPFHWDKNGDKIKISLGDELLHFDTEEITSMLAYESELPFEDIIIDYQGNDYKF